MKFTVRFASDWADDIHEDLIVNSLEELTNFQKEVGHRLIIDFEKKSIIVYDDYIE